MTTAKTVSNAIQARRLRSRYLRADLMADPAWDLLLVLLLAEIEQRRLPVTTACAATAGPMTTALRYLATLQREGLVARRADRYDARRVYVELTPKGSEAMRAYFAAVSELD